MTFCYLSVGTTVATPSRLRQPTPRAKKIINSQEAKARLSELLRRVEKGEEIIIGRGGRPIARLTAYRPDPEPRRPGSWRGRARMAEDFDELPCEFLDPFYSKEDCEQ